MPRDKPGRIPAPLGAFPPSNLPGYWSPGFFSRGHVQPELMCGTDLPTMSLLVRWRSASGIPAGKNCQRARFRRPAGDKRQDYRESPRYNGSLRESGLASRPRNALGANYY